MKQRGDSELANAVAEEFGVKESSEPKGDALIERVRAYIEKHGGTGASACKALGFNVQNYYNATSRTRKTSLVPTKRKKVRPIPVSVDIPVETTEDSPLILIMGKSGDVKDVVEKLALVYRKKE